jgi:twitching motility two-component system response regulator PilG
MSGSQQVHHTMPLASKDGLLGNDLAPRQTALLDATNATNTSDCNPSEGASADSLVNAISAAQGGNRPLARLQLEQAIQSDPDNPNAWLWFAWVADSPAAAISSLEQAQRRGSTSPLIQPALTWARGMEQFELVLANTYPTRDPALPHQRTGAVSSQELAVTSPLPNTTSSMNDDGHELKDRQSDNSTEDSTDESISSDLEQIIASMEPTKEPAGFPADNVHHLASESRSEEHVDAGNEKLMQNGSAGRIEAGAVLSQEPNVTSPLPKTTSFTNDGCRELKDRQSDNSTEDSTDESINSDLERIIASMEPTEEPAGFPADNVHHLASESRSEEHVDAGNEKLMQNGLAGRNEADGDACPESRPTILAIDDSQTIRGLVTMCLGKCGYEIVTAVDGIDAMKQLNTCNPSLILLDINMPRLNGYQLCKMLKDFPPTRSIPVIMLSGKDGAFDKFRGKRSGCDDYITKPFEASELRDKVASYLATKPLEATALQEKVAVHLATIGESMV